MTQQDDTTPSDYLDKSLALSSKVYVSENKMAVWDQFCVGGAYNKDVTVLRIGQNCLLKIPDNL